jgi:hypothetical protein
MWLEVQGGNVCFTNNVTLMRVCITIVAEEKQ